jgi:hypothetical protein
MLQYEIKQRNQENQKYEQEMKLRQQAKSVNNEGEMQQRDKETEIQQGEQETHERQSDEIAVWLREVEASTGGLSSSTDAWAYLKTTACIGWRTYTVCSQEGRSDL